MRYGVFLILFAAIFILSLGILTANAQTFVEVSFFWNANPERYSLALVIFLSFLSGAVVGTLMVATLGLQTLVEYKRLKKQNKHLTSELHDLRNAALREIEISDAESEII
ncbi:MAG: LapA family protein [Bacteroidetes bacterium]|nr:LapA family protein [Bacteroidota bacterium]